MQKRRSNRQVKRKKYAEEGEGKQSEEEAKASAKIKKNSAPLPAEQPLQLFVVSKTHFSVQCKSTLDTCCTAFILLTCLTCLPELLLLHLCVMKVTVCLLHQNNLAAEKQ